MTFAEVLIGFSIAFAIIGGAIFFAFRTSCQKGPTPHNIRGNGDHATEHHSRFDSGGGGGGGD